ncbi:cupin domain-containing protein [Mycoplasmatota bacterium]|nr:cupin domain-containing protein [Mycoplasmatota bacterium]
MNNNYNSYHSPYYVNTSIYNTNNMYNGYRTYPYPYWVNTPMYNSNFWRQFIELKDYGPNPFVVNIEEATKQNNNFRTTLWTGDHLQLTLMNINPGEEIGLEIHPNLDQFIRIEEGQGLIKMGDRKDRLNFQQNVYDDFALIIPAGKWHNLINTGNKPLKLYSIYAPVQHPYDTVHKTKADAEAAEH